jgi:hypothetical protein
MTGALAPFSYQIINSPLKFFFKSRQESVKRTKGAL